MNNNSVDINRISSPKNSAIRKLDAGPAIATFAAPYFLSFKLYGLNGTGFAHPIINPKLNKSKLNNRVYPEGRSTQGKPGTRPKKKR